MKDEDSLESYKLVDGNTVHLVRGRKANPVATTPVASTPVTSATSASAVSPQLPPLASLGAGPGMGGFPGMAGMPGLGQMGGAGMPGMGIN